MTNLVKLIWWKMHVSKTWERMDRTDDRIGVAKKFRTPYVRTCFFTGRTSIGGC
jgi:hypothetical protein